MTIKLRTIGIVGLLSLLVAINVVAFAYYCGNEGCIIRITATVVDILGLVLFLGVLAACTDSDNEITIPIPFKKSIERRRQKDDLLDQLYRADSLEDIDAINRKIEILEKIG